MPLLTWVNDERARSAASAVPFHLLEKVNSYGDESDAKENLLIQGDNLLALKALLPFYRGKIKCIYIDPPYNTGSAFGHYDDNLEHSQWLSMMQPRLTLLREFLTEDGSIWISIDDDEQAYLKVLMDEIFGRNNFINSVIWEKKYSPSNDAKWLSDSHDFILVYAKCKNIWRPNLLPRSEKNNKPYKYDDHDGRGRYRTGDVLVKTFSESGVFPIVNPFTGKEFWPPKGSCYRFNKETAKRLLDENRFYFGKTGGGAPQIKRYLSEVKQGVTSLTLWKRDEVGDNQEGNVEQKELGLSFETPKPERLIKRVLDLATKPGDLILDSFLGSGTSSAVAHKMGRRYIGIEMGEHAKTHCIPRLQKVIEGEQGGVSKVANWQGGGGFSFYKLGPTVFDEFGSINPDVDFKTLAAYIWQKETNTVTDPIESPYLGTNDGTSVFLLYNGILGDNRPEAGNVLTSKILRMLEKEYPFDGQKIIYGEAVLGLSQDELNNRGITFKQIPYDVTE